MSPVEPNHPSVEFDQARSIPPTSITGRRDGPVGTVKVVGDFDLQQRGLLAAEVRTLLDDGPLDRIEVDASGIRFMDSSGLTTLLAFQAAARAIGSTFLVSAASPHVRRVAELTGVAHLLFRGSRLADPVRRLNGQRVDE